MPLPRDFYAQPTLVVARALLGQRLVRILDGQRLGGRIVETEAYIGEADKANHAARGRRPRHAVMYGPPGYAYVYLIYGVHHALNAVTEGEGFPAAVLIRAIWPDEGLAVMQARRHQWRRLASLRGQTGMSAPPSQQLANGPGKLCQALGIDLHCNGMDLTTSDALWIEADDPFPDAWVSLTPRIGVGGDEEARTVPWRFVVDHRH